MLLSSVSGAVISALISSPFPSAQFTAFWGCVPSCAPTAGSRTCPFPPAAAPPGCRSLGRSRGPVGATCTHVIVPGMGGDGVSRPVPDVSKRQRLCHLRISVSVISAPGSLSSPRHLHPTFSIFQDLHRPLTRPPPVCCPFRHGRWQRHSHAQSHAREALREQRPPPFDAHEPRPISRGLEPGPAAQSGAPHGAPSAETQGDGAGDGDSRRRPHSLFAMPPPPVSQDG